MVESFSGRAVLAQDLRATMRLALPLVAAQLTAVGGNLIDVVMAGHLGAHTLAAVAVGANIWSLPLMAIIGVMMAMPPSVAQLDGARRRGEVGALFRQAVWLALVLGVVLQQALYWGGPALAAAMRVDPALQDDVRAFVRAVSWGAPGLALFVACRGLSDGLSMPRVSLVVGLCGLVVQLPLVWTLMYGRLGVPAMGAAGAGAANAVALWAQALAYLAYVRLARRFAGLGWESGRRRPDAAALFGLLRLGGPIAVAVLLEVGMFSATGLLVGRLGEVIVAAHQVALNVASITFMVPLGIAMTITVRVGNAVGRGDAVGVRRAGMVGIGMAGCAQALSCIAMLTVPHAIIALYTSDPRVLGVGVALLGFAGVFQLSDGIQVASAGALRGLKDTRLPMAITLFAYWGAGMPIGWFLAFPMGMGAQGMWMGLVVGLSCAAVLLFARFHRLSRLGAGLCRDAIDPVAQPVPAADRR
ncbi:MAG: MATE family efflux transporter [Rhodospirillales bacterium 70-18]|mgnify:CR=1 FL=1|nr:MAG: MATE family efflux transporter [Rhodospirillales bacterium 70-18]